MKEDIQAGNRLIAEFMGATVHNDWGKYLDATYYATKKKSPLSGVFTDDERQLIEDNDAKNLWKPKYHTSWDWLMPVVEKMNSMKYALSFDSYAGCEVYDYSKGFTSFITVDKDGLTLIECVYQSVIQFIQWYNQRKLENKI